MLRTAIIVALAGLSSAQLSGLSTQCMTALSGIVADPNANACLKPTDLLPIVTGSANTSIVPTVDTWTKHVCAAGPCSNDTLASIVKTVVTGCQQEITGESQGADPNTLASSITPMVQKFYPTVRKVLCLKHGDTMCDTELLQNIQNTTGMPLTIGNLIGLFGGLNLENIPKNITCTDCIHAAYTVISTDIPDIISDAAPALQSQCGASFTDGNIPSAISQSAADANPSSSNNTNTNNGASVLLPSALGAVGLIVVSTMMGFF